jgi:outer membrane immunogenic protein
VYNSVVGLEADISALSGSTQETIVRNPTGIVVTTAAAQRVDYLSTFRGRAGFAIADTLYYATAGLAIGHVKVDGSIAGACAVCTVYVDEQSAWRAGYTVGGGLEHAISNRNLLRLEFLYYDLGTQTLTLPETTGNGRGEFATMRFRSSGAIVRGGFSTRF